MSTAVESPSPSSRHSHSQGSSSEISVQENGSAVIERAQHSGQLVQEWSLVERGKDITILNACELPVNDESEIAHASRLQACTEKDAEIVGTPESSSSGWKVENSEAPKVPEGFTVVAESKFPITTERFFNLFFSDNARSFTKLFRKKCGDLEFQCSSWRLHEQMGHIRDVSFQHPIKIFIGPKFGSCKEVQKYCVYKNSHLVIETFQEVNDVPYGDYFRVEGLWHVERNNEINNGCILRVYMNVAFSKKTMLRGKIVQSAVEESRVVLAIWIELAHELLRQKHLEQRAFGRSTRLVVNNPAENERQATTNRLSISSSPEGNDLEISSKSPSPTVLDQRVPKTQNDEFLASLRGQSRVFGLLVIIVATILILMQMRILVLLCRPQPINVIKQVDYASNIYEESGVHAPAFWDKQINNLKGKITMVESSLDKIQKKHAILTKELKELELYRKKKS